MPAMILLSVWEVGAATILLIAALKGVPRELYEAATSTAPAGANSSGASPSRW